MKRTLGVWIGIILIVLAVLLYHQLVTIPSSSKPVVSPLLHATPTPLQKVSISQKSIFVPYWTVSSNLDTSQYDTAIYFGITPNLSGIDTTEEGYRSLSQFTKLQKSKKKLLVVRMITQDVNTQALKDMSLQSTIISDSVKIAKENGFDGIILDFEYSGLGFDPLVQSITTLSKNFALQTHKSNLLFYQMIYGDVFYRVRPFDVSALGQNVDGLFIMAYDLHKAGGNAGPNFPLQDNDYSFSEMIPAFLEKVAASKITVVFGMFGYDWSENEKKQSIGIAMPLSFLEIQEKFLENCTLKDCVVKRDPQASEQKITYTDAKGVLHEVWFEDTASVKAKENFLEQEGIGSVGFWAYTYF